MSSDARTWSAWRVLELARGADTVLDWPTRPQLGYERPGYLRLLAQAFARAASEGGVRALFSTAPRFGKTELAVAGIVRHLALHPDRTSAFVGYSAELAEAKSRRIRDAAERWASPCAPTPTASAPGRPPCRSFTLEHSTSPPRLRLRLYQAERNNEVPVSERSSVNIIARPEIAVARSGKLGLLATAFSRGARAASPWLTRRCTTPSP